MTSHAVSRGHLAPLVGRIFVVVGLRVYFAGIQSLFAFILLTHKIMILFCIGAGYIGHCVAGSIYFVTIKIIVQCLRGVLCAWRVREVSLQIIHKGPLGKHNNQGGCLVPRQ